MLGETQANVRNGSKAAALALRAGMGGTDIRAYASATDVATQELAVRFVPRASRKDHNRRRA